jgi:hypothetical protein
VVSEPVQIALMLGELVAGGLLGAVVGVWWTERRADRQAEADAVVERDRARAETKRALSETAQRTDAAVARALRAHVSLRARLVGVADSAADHVQALERLHDVGVLPQGLRANADWRAPAELSRDLPRPGPEECWQALDRSFDGVLAALDDPEATFAEHALAYAAVGVAAHGIADALSEASSLELAAACSFCAKDRRKVSRLIAGPGVYVCDQCVALCVRIMEEEVGEGWREEAERWLDGGGREGAE